MNAEIITIGDEILIGQVIDTNSAWLATELNKLGIGLIRISSVGDIHENILKALEEASSRADLIIVTGGLGPTSDDITKPALASYFGSRMVSSPLVLENIQALLSSRGVQMNERNIRQAEVPDNCEILHNPAGTAPGMWFKKNGKDYISLPGVPYEMKVIFEQEIAPRLKQSFLLPAILHKTVLTQGVPESEMANRIQAWETALPGNLKLAYLPSPGILRLRITGTASGDPVELQQTIHNEILKLKALVGDHIFGYDDDKLEVIIGKLLTDNNLSLSISESCTGGLLSSMITAVPGASVYFKGAVVAYSNEIKTSELNVSPYTLIMHGTVSQATVEQMADGIRMRYKTDFAVAVSGIAGPSGGTEEKAVGTTWIAVASKKRIITNAYNFGEDRGRNMQKAAITGLFMLLKEIKDCL